MNRILITGPESTGKTELAYYLSRHTGGRVVPEYARKYVQNLQRPYTYEDVLTIAERQSKYPVGYRQQPLDFH